MNIVAKQSVTDAVDAAMREVVSASHRPEGSYVRLPILYPSGSEVVVRVSGGPYIYFVTDFGMGYTEAELMGAERIYMRQAKEISQAAGVGFDDHAFFAVKVPRERLPGGIVTISNCSAEAMVITAFKAAEKATMDASEFMIEKLEGIFGTDRVHRDETIVGASNHEWAFAASVMSGRKRIVFEYATKHPNSVASVAMKMDDVSRLDGAPRRIVMVRDKAEMGTYLGVLAHSANVVEDRISAEKIRELAEVA